MIVRYNYVIDYRWKDVEIEELSKQLMFDVIKAFD